MRTDFCGERSYRAYILYSDATVVLLGHHRLAVFMSSLSYRSLNAMMRSSVGSARGKSALLWSLLREDCPFYTCETYVDENLGRNR